MKKTIIAGVVATLFAGMASAALVKQSFTSQSLTSSVMTNDYLNVSVQAGDVVVMTAVGNKAPSTPVEFSSTAGAFTLFNTVAANVNPTVYSGYQVIATAGSYDFHARAPSAIWGYSGLYILRADSGAIQFLGSANFAVASDSAADQTLSYNWSGAEITNGLAIEAVAGSIKDVITPNDVSRDGVNTFQRILCSGFFSGSTFSSRYSFAVAMKSSGVGLAFSEGSATPLPPDFGSDPVVKADAIQNLAYTGTLAFDASDPNGDPMTFLLSPGGPVWLAVATDGTLSGTPLVSDFGTNQWMVSVTDGISGTNSATLQIVVTDSDFSSVPLTSTELYLQGAHYVNIDANGMNFHRLDFGKSYVNVSAVRAKTTTGAKLSFFTRSDTVKLYFTYIPGDENRNSRFGIYQNGTQVDTPYFSSAESNIVVTLTSQSAPGELVRYDVALPNWSNPILSKMELKNGEVLEVGNPYPRKQMVVLGDSISHGTGQGASYLTYPYIAADIMDLELLNMAVGGGKIAPEVADLLQDFEPVETIWILAGYNNWQGGSEDIATITNSYETLLATVRAHQPDAEVFCCTLTATTNIDDLESGVTAVEVRQGVSDVVNARIAAGDMRLHLVDGLSISTEVDLNDAVHFTEEGAARVATNVVAVMDPIVNPPRPNILFIAIDDMNPILGCYGNDKIISPHMDSLAASGVTFLNAHAQWSVCGPSRASLSTGLMPEEILPGGFKKMRGLSLDGLRDNGVVRPNVVTLEQWFRYNGYRTAATGKINDSRCVGTVDPITGKVSEDGDTVDDPPSWGDPVDPDHLPADFFSNSAYVRAASGVSGDGTSSTAIDQPDSDFTDGKICDEGLLLLQNLATNDAPFFLGVGFKKPHLAFVAPQQYWDYYERTNFTINAFQDHPLHEVSFTWNYATELASYDDFYDSSPGSTAPAIGIPCTNIPEAKQQELLHGYYACISFIDVQVGRLLAELEAQGLADNTIVVLWGDHGFQLGGHGEWAKHTNLERATRVPFIIRNPWGGQVGVETGTPAALMDLYPTLCDLAGLPIPEQPLAENEATTATASGRSLKGVSLAGVVNGSESSVRTGAVNLFQRDGHSGYAYRTDRYRYTEWVDAGAVQARELYDYWLDPLETVNLAGEPGFDALMYSFSKSMRKEFDDMELNPSDQAAPELQAAPIKDTTNGDRSLAGLNWSNAELAWPDAAGSTYHLLSKTNLQDSSWSTNQMNLIGSPAVILPSEQQEFFQVHVAE